MKRILTAALLAASLLSGQTALAFAGHQRRADDSVEPGAGDWRTWVISSGADYRVPPPPSPAETQAELRSLVELVGQNGEQERRQIAY